MFSIRHAVETTGALAGNSEADLKISVWGCQNIAILAPAILAPSQEMLTASITICYNFDYLHRRYPAVFPE